jgi:uncharacterized protein with PQ loop repeat
MKKEQHMKNFIQTHFTGVNNQLGWAGVILLQGATLPSMIDRVFGSGEAATLPPLSMVLMVWAGLGLYLARAIRQNDVVYMVSNGIGLALNTVLMAMIIFP